jgi:hypothetical protein
VEFLLNRRVEVRVCQVDIGHELSQETFGTLQTAFEGLNVLRCRISPPIGRLVVCTFIAVDGAVRAGLLSVAFNLLTATLIACARHSAPFLDGL